MRDDSDGLLEEVKQREELMPFLGGLDDEELSLQLGRLEAVTK